MPLCFLWITFIFLLTIQCFAKASKEIDGSNPIALNLNSDFGRFKRDSTAQNVTSNTDTKLTEHLFNSTDTVTYNSTHNVPSWMIPIKSGALQRTGFLVLGFMIIILCFLPRDNVYGAILMLVSGSEQCVYLKHTTIIILGNILY